MFDESPSYRSNDHKVNRDRLYGILQLKRLKSNELRSLTQFLRKAKYTPPYNHIFN